MKSLSACYYHSQASTYKESVLVNMLPFILITGLALALIALWANARMSNRGPKQVRMQLTGSSISNAAHSPVAAAKQKPGPTRVSATSDRLRELQVQLRTRESVIRRLMGSADEYDETLAEQSKNLESKDQLLNEHRSLLRDRDARLQAMSRLEPLVAEGKNKIDELQQQLRQVGLLESALHKKEEIIQQLRNRVSHLDTLATVLSNRIGALQPQAEQALQLKAELDDRDRLIRDLEFSSQKTITDLRLTVTSKDKDIGKLKRTMQDIVALQNSLVDKDNKISQLQRTVAELEHSVATGQAKLDELESDANRAVELQHAYDRQADHVAGLETEIRERDDQIDDLQLQTKELQNNDQSATLQQELDDRTGQIDELKTEIREKGQLIKDLQLQDTELEKLRFELTIREQKFKQVQAQVLALGSVQETLEEREQTIAEQSDELARLAPLAASVAEKDKELAELREASAKLKASQARAAGIRMALGKADQLAIAAQQGAVEAQRLRQELQLLGRGTLAQPTPESHQTDVQPDDQPESVELSAEAVQQIHTRIQDIERLETDTATREKKLADLQKKLATLTKAGKRTATPKRATKSGKTGKVAKRIIHEPIFDAPNQRDDLKKIHGIGPVLEKTLNQIGVTTYQQLASFNEDDITKVTKALGIIPNRIERDDWIGGARKVLAQANGAH